MNIINRTSILLLTGSGILCSCASPDEGSDAEVKRIGMIYPFTGALAEQGRVFQDTPNWTFDYINDHGGVSGKTLAWEQRDSQSDPAVGAAVAEELIADGCNFMFGAISSGVTMQVAATASARGALVINGISSSPAVTDQELNGLFYRTLPTIDGPAALVAQVMHADGDRKLAMIVNDSTYTATNASYTVAAFESLCADCRVVASESYSEDADPSSYDWASHVTAALATSPDTLFISGWMEDTIELITVAEAQGYTGLYYVSEVLASDSVPSLLPASTLARMRYGTFLSPNLTGFLEIGTRYVAAPEVSFPSRQAATFDALILMALAMEKAGTDDPVAVAAAIREIANPPGVAIDGLDFENALALVRAGEDVDYQGIIPIDFDEKGEITSSNAAVMQWMSDGTKLGVQQ